ncbi:MAG: uroporphyrinogen decarboxylase family protein [Oscillospiraceae bacterium]|nr:uroporphyrinogen decarboxylase family protein [Oscillospiraceae bacterium]
MEDQLHYPELDVEQFWKDNELALQDNCFNENAPQVAFGLDYVEDEVVINELEPNIHPWRPMPLPQLMELRKRYNDKAEKIIGKRMLKEEIEPHQYFPPVKLHGEVLGGVYNVTSDYVTWLSSDIQDPKGLEAMLDNLEKNTLPNLRDFILPANWDTEKKRIFEETGRKPDAWWYGRRVRGPVTLAMSIYGVEKMIFLLVDEPDLAHRFMDDIGDVLMGYIKIFEQEAGIENIRENQYPYRFNDDNCCMLNDELYEEFAFPVLKRIFDYASPKGSGLGRYQHSDSAMAHLLPVLSKLDFTAVNFGPTVLLDQIRKYMPNTRVDGCLSPMTLMRNDEEAIISEVRRDCEMAKSLNTKGLLIYTAGSVNYGTKLTSIRAAMYAVQKYGRY